jgi:hypothetical protein
LATERVPFTKLALDVLGAYENHVQTKSYLRDFTTNNLNMLTEA